MESGGVREALTTVGALRASTAGVLRGLSGKGSDAEMIDVPSFCGADVIAGWSERRLTDRVSDVLVGPTASGRAILDLVRDVLLAWRRAAAR